MASNDQDRPDPAHLAAIGKTETAFMSEVEAARTIAGIETPDETGIAAARYDAAADRIVIDLAGGMTLLVPPGKLQALDGASSEDLSDVDVISPHMLEWPRIDQQVYIPDLLRGITGTKAWMTGEAARALGARTSPAKAASSRENGKKGGRPRKRQA